MKTLVVYDSIFGNTGEIARLIHESLLSKEDVCLYHVKEIQKNNLHEVKLFIVGSPTRGFRPTPEITSFIKNLTSHEIKGKKVAAFDTRLSLPDIHSSFVKFIVKNGGYAANSIANQLIKKGGQLLVQPEGFLVTSDKGPLKHGERERVTQWIYTILNKLQ